MEATSVGPQMRVDLGSTTALSCWQIMSNSHNSPVAPHDAETYLITGATGDVGSKVVHQLLELGHRPRVFARDAAKARLQFGQSVDIFVGDLADKKLLAAALDGAHALFLITTGPRIPVLDQIAADAAKATGIRHIVKLSSLDVEQHLAIGAWHEHGEAAIRASGIPFTFVRPALVPWRGTKS